ASTRTVNVVPTRPFAVKEPSSEVFTSTGAASFATRPPRRSFASLAGSAETRTVAPATTLPPPAAAPRARISSAAGGLACATGGFGSAATAGKSTHAGKRQTAATSMRPRRMATSSAQSAPPKGTFEARVSACGRARLPDMATVALDGTPAHTYGTLPAVGTTAPPFELVGTDLRNTTLRDFS